MDPKVLKPGWLYIYKSDSDKMYQYVGQYMWMYEFKTFGWGSGSTTHMFSENEVRDSMVSFIRESKAQPCDCGGAKSAGTHSHWCSVNKKPEPAIEDGTEIGW